MPNREDSNPFIYNSHTADAPLSRQQSQEEQDAAVQEHRLLVERFRAHFADKYTAQSPSNPKGPAPAQMVQIELAHNAEAGHDTLKKAFYRPIWLAWNVVSFAYLGGTWVGTEVHAGGNLQRELESGRQLITLSEPQSKILDALADFAQIPEYKRHPRVIPIPDHFRTYHDRLEERHEKDKQKYHQEQEAQSHTLKQHPAYTTIQENMLRQGYIRPRDEIANEIRQRQQRWKSVQRSTPHIPPRSKT